MIVCPSNLLSHPYLNFYIHLSADGHLGCFHVLVIVNSVAVNIGLLISDSSTHVIDFYWKITLCLSLGMMITKKAQEFTVSH